MELKLKIFTPKEICEKIPSVTRRQITDLAEKGLITPIKETSGQGVPRLYDMDGVFKISLAVTLRNVIAPREIANIIGMLKHDPDGEMVVLRKEGKDFAAKLEPKIEKIDPECGLNHRSGSSEVGLGKFIQIVVNLRDLRAEIERAFA